MKLMKKIGCGLLALALMLPLTGCDLFGGEKADAALYHLTLSYSANAAADPAFKQEDLTAKLAFGSDGELSRDEGEIEELKKAGATDEDIAKAGVRQSDGSYYFFAQDPMFLNTPEVEGYFLKGFYFKGTDTKAFNPVPTMIDGVIRQPRWNMESRDVELEARYEYVNYTVTYCYGIERGHDRSHSGVMPGTAHSNPATYNYGTEKDVALTAPTETINGYEFKYWYYTEDGSAEKIVCESLPKVLNENAIHPMTYGANGDAQYGLTLFAFYDLVSPEVTLTVDPGVTVTVKKDGIDGEPVDLSSGSVKFEYGTILFVRVDDSEIDIMFPEQDHAFEGLYINGIKVADVDLGGGLTRPSNVADITVDKNITIAAKVKEVAE